MRAKYLEMILKSNFVTPSFCITLHADRDKKFKRLFRNTFQLSPLKCSKKLPSCHYIICSFFRIIQVFLDLLKKKIETCWITSLSYPVLPYILTYTILYICPLLFYSLVFLNIYFLSFIGIRNELQRLEFEINPFFSPIRVALVRIQEKTIRKATKIFVDRII